MPTANTGFILAPAPGGNKSVLNINARAVVSAVPAILVTVTVVALGTGPGFVWDTNTTTGVGAANLIGTIPNALGTYYFNSWPCFVGIVVQRPTSSGAVVVAYS